MSTLTWIREKELAIKNNKGDQFRWKNNLKFYIGFEKMRNASGFQGLNEWQRKYKVNRNTYNISCIKRVTRKFLEVSRCSRPARTKLFFAN